MFDDDLIWLLKHRSEQLNEAQSVYLRRALRRGFGEWTTEERKLWRLEQVAKVKATPTPVAKKPPDRCPGCGESGTVPVVGGPLFSWNDTGWFCNSCSFKGTFEAAA